ncbi:MAG: hypothetical protein WBD78_13400 [Methylocella sp.]
MRLEVFSFLTGNRRGKPRVSHQEIVHLIAATTPKTGRELAPAMYPAGVKDGDYVIFKAAM